MIKQWKIIESKVAAMKRRERYMALFAALAPIGFAMYHFALEPTFKEQKNIAETIDADSKKLNYFKTEIQRLENTPITDPDAQNRNKLNDILQQQKEAEAALSTMHKQLVSPDEMGKVLRDVLLTNNKLSLESIKTLEIREIEVPRAAPPIKVESVKKPEQNNPNNKPKPNEKPEKEEKIEKVVVYQHGIEIRLKGRYFDLLDYLQTLEKLPWHLQWGGIQLSSKEPPISNVTITLYTLSLDKNWLSL